MPPDGIQGQSNRPGESLLKRRPNGWHAIRERYSAQDQPKWAVAARARTRISAQRGWFFRALEVLHVGRVRVVESHRKRVGCPPLPGSVLERLVRGTSQVHHRLREELLEGFSTRHRTQGATPNDAGRVNTAAIARSSTQDTTVIAACSFGSLDTRPAANRTAREPGRMRRG